MKLHCLILSTTLALAFTLPAGANEDLRARINSGAAAVEQKVITWRRDLHAHPELGNRETRTAKLVAKHLKALGMEVTTGVAHTGVVGVLRGGKPGRVVALRADMDALPVTEPEGLPFASKVRTTFNDQDTGVMHACGHDAHVAMLMGAAEILAGMRDELPGTIMFIFQPAEEGAPKGEEGGAELMVKEGVLDGEAKPEAIFGLHVWPVEPGHIYVRPEGMMAASDRLYITVHGRQTHGSQPWNGVDPITVAAQIITALQTIVSRQVDLTRSPAVISLGSIHGGIRHNIIPDDVALVGTIRTFDKTMQEDIWRRIKTTVEHVALSAGATAEVEIDPHAPVVRNDPALLERMGPALKWAAGEDAVHSLAPVTGGEDFAFYADRIPAVFLFLGINKPGVTQQQAAPNHSPLFYVNEAALIVGVRTLGGLAVDYLSQAPE
ncbi:MAG: N-acyl-L-amino acid amidohydrolase [Gammaproteobacteria bacterium RIFCSPLOWO2_02_FULL_61_13]|nr:MAG: N-acyl-L-amino acid amidohydrolase [Gammaproteobacteria bacterium RIFCSPLOWO2_02_FULL_61_13]